MRGKGVDKNLMVCCPQDHPRLCGEKFVSHLRFLLFGGSPPPMRGKVQQYYLHEAYDRITPAYAGKSNDVRSRQIFPWDHPRLCGEKQAGTL